MKKFKQGFCALLRAAFARGMACAMALVIFFESCARYDLAPREEEVLAEAQRRAARGGSEGHPGGYEPAIRLSAEDIAFRDQLAAMMQRASESPEAARAILAEQTLLPEGDARRLDAFTLSMVRVMGDAALQAAIAAGDKEQIVARLLALRGEVQVDESTREQLERIAAEYGVEVGEGSNLAELAPSAFFSVATVFVFLAVALIAGVVSYIGIATALGVAASEVKVLGTEDKLIPLAYGADAYLVLDSLEDAALRRQVEEELAERYEQEVFEYLQCVFPETNAQLLRAQAEQIVSSITGHRRV